MNPDKWSPAVVPSSGWNHHEKHTRLYTRTRNTPNRAKWYYQERSLGPVHSINFNRSWSKWQTFSNRENRQPRFVEETGCRFPHTVLTRARFLPLSSFVEKFREPSIFIYICIFVGASCTIWSKIIYRKKKKRFISLKTLTKFYTRVSKSWNVKLKCR